MSIEKAKDALKIAREAMKERRAYCEAWEYKYGHEWDLEDGYIRDAIAELEKTTKTCKWDLVGYTYWPDCRKDNCTDKMSFGKNITALYTFCPFCGRKIEAPDA